MSVSFGKQFDHDTGISGPSEHAATIGESWANAIPPASYVNGFHDAALFWAAHIGPVFPLYVARNTVPDENAKKPHPQLSMGDGSEMQRGTSDLNIVSSWWNQLPRAGIGFAPQRAGILIVDIDPRHHGNESWRELCDRHGINDADAGRVISPRGDGGRHLWFRLPDGVSYPHGQLGPGLDRPWQTPVPPSVRYVDRDLGSKDPSQRYAFRPYRWVAGDPRCLPVAPPVLYGMSGVIESEVFHDKYWMSSDQSIVWNGRGDLQLGGQVIAELMRTGVTLEVQQNRLFKRIACHWIRKGYSSNQILSMLMDLADRSEQDTSNPWTIKDMEKIERTARNWMQRDDAASDATYGAMAADLVGKQQ